MAQTLISQAAFDLIVAEEVSSRAVYERKYRRPEWPGGASGITIGIGYDIGAGVASREQLLNDWHGRISNAMIGALEPCIGRTGAAAKALLPSVRFVDVPWDAAIGVFETRTLPKYYGLCTRALPNFEKLSLDCKGALVSLVYNRGASFSSLGDRYTEMRAIKIYMRDSNFGEIPDAFRSMKRLWVGKGLDGLLARRDREAKLFERGLTPAASRPPSPLLTKPWWQILLEAIFPKKPNV